MEGACWVESLVGGDYCLLGGASAEPRDPGRVRRTTCTEGWPRFYFHNGLGSQARCLCHFESCDGSQQSRAFGGRGGFEI
jgi:hypothetical protein